ncbi:MAG: hypothetical protein ACI4XL_03395 [Bacillus sp. (in: firmicutes)]
MTTNRTVNIGEVKANQNYARLIEYAREKEIHLGKNDFKAVLYAMNGMSIYNRTKQEAVRKAAIKYGVTQASVREHIKGMNFHGEREWRNRREVKKPLRMETDILKKRLEREED